MKTRFSSYDIICSVTELQRLVGMRVANIYDVDNKTYLIKLQRTEEKCVLLLESGNRFHTTAFEWPKNMAPSGFSMKLRKHLRNKRLESLRQLGLDRIVDLQFGTGEAAYHVILELYDRGNIILTDYQLMILNILRPHTEGEAMRFAVKERYPTDRARDKKDVPSIEDLTTIINNAKPGDTLKKALNPHLEYGPAVIDHVLLETGFVFNCKIEKNFDIKEDMVKLHAALLKADQLMLQASQEPSKGYIIQRKEERPSTTDEKVFIYTYQEFHPLIFMQHKSQLFREFATFDAAVDEYFSMLEGQKIDIKALQQEREAMKKLDNVRKDHVQRLVALEGTQETDKQRAELITRNQELVDNATLAVQGALATQISWPEIQSLITAAQSNGDPIASSIKQLKLESNHITLYLSDPYASHATSDEEGEQELKPMLIDIDLALSAFANAQRYYNLKRNAAKKQQKTIESQSKALKSAEKKTKQTLKEVQAITSINKARKVYWFEKFYWFISSENYLVIGGRDQQQNELIVKRYMRPDDIYVHADLHGASSVVVKNPTGEMVPPKTLNEAGVMAICYSVAWEAKVVTSAWWVKATQVSKTAPTGEYLTTGSFIIRGKKNYLPPCHLIMGFSFLFKLEEGSVERHKDERRIRTLEEDAIHRSPVNDENQTQLGDIVEEEDINLDSGDEDEEPNSGAEKHPDNSSDESSDKESTFPDTQIKIQHFSGTKINILPDSKTMMTPDDENDYDRVVFLGDEKPIILKPGQKSRGNSESKTKGVHVPKVQEIKPMVKQVKRGQKSKLKKIKEKYKDQDEDERQLRMEILQSAGSAKESKKNKKESLADSKKGRKTHPKPPQILQEKRVQKLDIEGDEEDAKEEIVFNADVDMLDSLTGVPVIDDELLFAVPVVAPYNTLINYKYKVKLTPGTGKRGKASRTAVSMFLRDKITTPREKDLLRSVKDENMARNLPGKVKLSAPKLQAYKK